MTVVQVAASTDSGRRIKTGLVKDMIWSAAIFSDSNLRREECLRFWLV